MPDENGVLDFVQGPLGEAEVAAIDEHVDGCLSCRQAIDEAVRAFGQRSTHFEAASGPVAAVTRFSAGDTLAGRYRIIRFIARGGMGEVYEAEDAILGTRLAVKTVAATISDNPRAARRLKQEVNLARRITHPNVCRIFDLGVHGDAERTGGICSSPWSWSPASASPSGCAKRGRFHRRLRGRLRGPWPPPSAPPTAPGLSIATSRPTT